MSRIIYLRSHPIVIVVLDAIRLSTVAGKRMMVAGRWPHHRLEALPAVRARRLAAVRRPGNASIRKSVQEATRQLGFQKIIGLKLKMQSKQKFNAFSTLKAI